MIRLALFLTAVAFANVQSQAQETIMRAESLLEAGITGVPSHDLMMTRVHIPAGTTLPMHYHPTEEYLYILEGEAYLRIKGQDDQLLTAGTAIVIPAGAVHTAVTTDSSAVALTTRVHPKGQPVRLPAPAEKD